MSSGLLPKLAAAHLEAPPFPPTFPRPVRFHKLSHLIERERRNVAANVSGRELKVALLGFGTVGGSAARILLDLKPQGLRLTHVYNRNVARKRADWVPSSVVWTESIEDVLGSDVDVVVELVGGLDPAGEWIRRALEAGKSVVTANKKLIAYQGVELENLARSKGAALLYGAAV